MEGIINMILIALLAASVLSLPGERLKRNYHNEHGGIPTGFEAGSDEPDASVENLPCGLLDNSGPGHEYGFEGAPGRDDRRGVSVKAAAAASSSTYS